MLSATVTSEDINMVQFWSPIDMIHGQTHIKFEIVLKRDYIFLKDEKFRF